MSQSITSYINLWINNCRTRLNVFPAALIFLFFTTAASKSLNGQELYVFSEPASNMPAKSISAKYSGKFLRSVMHGERTEQRHTAELMFGIDKNLMIHGAATFSDMYTEKLRFESARIYGKYRFLSNDDVHRHFRMAAFGEASLSRNDVMYDELSLEGDQSGLQAGIIATQLWNKLAVSATISATQVISDKPKLYPDEYTYQAFNYSLSAGYLLLPFEYRNYNQTNVNLYLEMLGQQSLDRKGHLLDLAPAIQFIFRSTYKLNIGYRFQVSGNMIRMADNSFHVSFESVFLNALKKRQP